MIVERILQEIHARPVPDIVALTGDNVDSDAHVDDDRIAVGELPCVGDGHGRRRGREGAVPD